MLDGDEKLRNSILSVLFFYDGHVNDSVFHLKGYSFWQQSIWLALEVIATIQTQEQWHKSILRIYFLVAEKWKKYVNQSKYGRIPHRLCPNIKMSKCPQTRNFWGHSWNTRWPEQWIKNMTATAYRNMWLCCLMGQPAVNNNTLSSVRHHWQVILRVSVHWPNFEHQQRNHKKNITRNFCQPQTCSHHRHQSALSDKTVYFTMWQMGKISPASNQT